jgi:HEAT repeat protein
MHTLAYQLRDLLIPALMAASAGILLLLAIVIAQRLVRNAAAWRLARLRQRYLPLLQAATGEAGPARASAIASLGRARGHHRRVAADALLEPLRVVQGSAVDLAREVAGELGLLDEWRRGLGRGSWSARSKAALALGLVRDRDAVPLLVRLLDDAHDETRAAAVDALGSIGDVAAIEALLERIGEQSRHQQARLVEALRRIGPAVTASIVSLGAEAPVERRMIAEILALVGGTGARVTLMEWTADADALVRAAAWRAIGMIGMDDRAAYHALRALGDEDPRVRAQAAQALGRTGRTDFVPYLQSHLDDEWEVAAQGARALARLGDQGRAALQAREDSGAGGHGLELARHFLWEQRRS